MQHRDSILGTKGEKPTGLYCGMWKVGTVESREFALGKGESKGEFG